MSGGAACAQSLSLECGIEHSEFMQPVEGFHIGSQIDHKLLPSGDDARGHWWQVPDWMAGKWHKTGKIDVLSFTDLKTNEPVKSKKRLHVHYPDNEVLGHQQDRHGQIWTYIPIPCVIRTQSGGRTNVSVLRSFDVVDDSKDNFTVRMYLFSLVTEGEDKVISICQRECLQTWTPIDNDTISIVESTKFFDKEGEAIYAKKTQTYSEKCGKYCQVNWVDRQTQRPLDWGNYKAPEELAGSVHVPIDLRNSLAEFLKTKNLTSLIP